jgi:hypothetical protein
VPDSTEGTVLGLLPPVYRSALLLFLISSGEARAEGPWSILFGAGPALQHRIDYSPGDAYSLGGSARLDAGYRVAPPLAIGVHLGIDIVREVDSVGGSADTTTVTHVPFELGIGAQLGFAKRFVVAPWFGKLDLVEERRYVIGTELAFDLEARGPDRLSALATAMWAHRSTGDGWSSFSVGLAWRYW